MASKTTEDEKEQNLEKKFVHILCGHLELGSHNHKLTFDFLN